MDNSNKGCRGTSPEEGLFTPPSRNVVHTIQAIEGAFTPPPETVSTNDIYLGNAYYERPGFLPDQDSLDSLPPQNIDCIIEAIAPLNVTPSPLIGMNHVPSFSSGTMPLWHQDYL
jgi:hypothetical protein